MIVSRFTLGIAMMLASVCASSVAYAACTVPYTLTNGQVADASNSKSNGGLEPARCINHAHAQDNRSALIPA